MRLKAKDLAYLSVVCAKERAYINTSSPFGYPWHWRGEHGIEYHHIKHHHRPFLGHRTLAARFRLFVAEGGGEAG